MKKKIYALIVGIDTYPKAPLKGCVKDSEHMVAFLKSPAIQANYDTDIVIRHNEKATKKEITKQFKEHLGQATENDVAFFSFSGHGAQETADTTIWHEEPDGKLEGIVCYDSIEKKLLLADKELRFLIQGVAAKKPHVLTIFDCCHSGENTRGLEDDEQHRKRILSFSKMSTCFPKRQWEDFCFTKSISKNDVINQPLYRALPSGNHIHLAASRSDQFAFETKLPDWGQGGIFTYTLLKILNRSNGVVTYFDLKSRMLNYIKNQFDQTPNIFVKGDNSHEIFKTFLGGEQASLPMYGNVVYDKKLDTWILDMGSMHGISKQAKTVKVLVGKKEIEATITQVNPSDTAIQLADSSDLSLKEGEFQAYVHPFKSAPIGLYINGDEFEAEAKNKLAGYIREKGTNINLVAEEKLADYTVQLDKWYYTITLPFDPFRPLVYPTDQMEDDAVQLVFTDLYHISQWEFCRLLHNSDSSSRLQADAIKIEFFDGTTGDPIPIKNEIVSPILHSDKAKNKFKAKLTNTSSSKLFVATLNLGVNFEVNPNLLANRVQLLEPGGFVWLVNNKAMTYFVESCKTAFNWEESISYFKIISSTHPFEVANLELPALADPVNLLKEPKRTSKGIGREEPIDSDAERWTTRTLEFHIKNPNYNKVSVQKLAEDLETAAGPYLAGLYLEEKSAFSSELKLREGITALEEESELTKGFIMNTTLNLANWISRRHRHKKYKKQVKKNPSIIKVVSEGDSWFQHPHPKVKDIIDHLFRDYAIYSLGAAGDELVNYYNRQEYLPAIEKINPKFLLLSGGGNDILGPEFNGFLRDDITEALRFEKPEDLNRFMNQSFFDKITLLEDTYVSIFHDIKEQFPDLQILIHGYDFVIPLASKKKGWLGRYMIAKKIARQEDRRQLIKYLLVEFNEMLSKKADLYPNVHYINACGSVEDDRWYDEIHPDSNGFKMVADRFLEKMRELGA